MDQKAKDRVAIAKDVLKWIKAGALIPRTNQEVIPTNDIKIEDYDKPLNSLNLGVCKVCAMGALMLGEAVRDNGFTARTFHYDGGRKVLLNHFTQNQLDLIEAYFEGTTYSWHHNRHEIDVEKARQFFIRHESNDSERMTLIFQNVIDNDGTFKPEQLS